MTGCCGLLAAYNASIAAFNNGVAYRAVLNRKTNVLDDDNNGLNSLYLGMTIGAQALIPGVRFRLDGFDTNVG